MNRRHALSSLVALFSAPLCLGCAGPLLLFGADKEVAELEQELDIELIGDVTHPYGMNFVRIEDVGLVVGLGGTGGDPPPSPQRSVLIGEMKRREVDEPGKVLASPNTAMVLVGGFLRPGAQKGDRFDVEVKVPSRDSTTSLRGGKLLPARLSELAAVGQQIHSGHVVAYAEGPVLVDPSATAEDEALATHGRILGGGVVQNSRSLGLVVHDRYASIRLSQLVGTAINRRFHTIYKGEKQGVANPKKDTFIELRVHPRYRQNISRYMQVIRSIAIEESASELQDRLNVLENQLSEPLTMQAAALRLEAIGTKEAIDVLKRAAATQRVPAGDARFYAAETLAYLDQTEAVEPLAAVIREDPHRRVQALAALSAMNDRNAYDALRTLLNEQSAETRYGAFRALWAMNKNDPLVNGEVMGGNFTLHFVPSSGPAMVHATNSLRPEIVLFGGPHKLRLPATLDAGRHILVNGTSGRDITVSRFAPGLPVQQRVVEPDLEQVIRAIVDLGGTYPDVVQMLQEARDADVLSSWFRVDAIPDVGRPEDRESPVTVDEPRETSAVRRFATSWPSLFGDK
jgi:hypothetical protein